MAYNNKEVLKDLQGSTIPQYYNPVTDSYEPLEGSDGANKVVILDANGSEVVSTQVVQPILDKLDQLTGTVLAEENRKVFEDYDPLKQYYVGNKVAYEGSSYYVLVEPPIGTLPSNTTYFLLIAEKGDTGNSITNITDNLDGTITITYGEGQTVDVTFIGNVASNVSYNNTTSGLIATTVQSAIDELDGVVDTKLDSSDIANNLTTTTTGMALDATQGKAINDSLVAHQAENVSQSGGVHGLVIEEGLWTPTVIGMTTAGEGTYVVRLGTYKRIGKIVFIHCLLNISAHTGTGHMRISGLPFTPNGNYSLAVGLLINLTMSANHVLHLYTLNGIPDIAFQSSPVGGGAIATVQIDTSFNITCGGFYFIN